MFNPPDAEMWAGDFRADGINRRVGCCAFADGSTILVIARGRGYVIDLATRALLYAAREDLWGVVAVPGRDFVLAHSYTDLFGYSRSGELWRSDRIAYDGIGFDEVTTNYVRGMVYLPHGAQNEDDEWSPFRLTFDGWRYEGPTHAEWMGRKG
jgi:hypothetical protein